MRHAEAESNLIDSLDTAPPGPELTGRGREQARAAKESLAAMTLGAVYASASTRARSTAEIVARDDGLSVETAPGMTEFSAGTLEGSVDPHHRAVYYGVLGSWLLDEWDNAMPGGDTGRVMIERAASTLTEIATRHRGTNVLVVTHGGLARGLTSYLDARVPFSLRLERRLQNTETIELLFDGKSWECARWADVNLESGTGLTEV
jgi:broad specificity phosphatase PhoE